MGSAWILLQLFIGVIALAFTSNNCPPDMLPRQPVSLLANDKTSKDIVAYAQNVPTQLAADDGLCRSLS